MNGNTTNRQILLRAVEPSDADFMYEVENDIDAWSYSDTIAPISRKILRDYALCYEADPFSAKQLRLIITDSDGCQLGIVDLYDISPRHRNAFVGIYLLPTYRLKGIACDALNILADYSSEILGLEILGAKIPESNTPSIQAFRKAGYKDSSVIPDWLLRRDGKREALCVFTRRLV